MKHYPHETTVLGIFKDRELASEGIRSLAHLRLKYNDIHYVKDLKAYEQEDMVKLFGGQKLHNETVHKAKLGFVAGAALFGATAVTGVLTGGGSLIAASPLIALASGAGGSLVALLQTGFTESEAQKVDNALVEGEVAVVVHAKDRKIAHQAQKAFQEHGADQVRLHH